MSTPGHSGRPVVLIVEDEPLVCAIAVEEFEDAGYEVLTAGDDRSALTVLEGKQGIDLLFTDIRIPGKLDGWGIANTARRLRPGLPIIYATGFSAEQPRMLEGSRFFQKPYRVTAIIAAARELVEELRTGADDTVSAGSTVQLRGDDLPS